MSAATMKCIVVLVAAWIWLVPADAYAQSNGIETPTSVAEALGALESDDWRVRVAGLRVLGQEAAPEHVAVIAEQLDASELAVINAAADALARIPGDESFRVLNQRLGGPNGEIREAVSIALLRHAPTIDDDLGARLELELTSPDAKAWIRGRDTIDAIRESLAASADLFLQLEAIANSPVLDPQCVDREAAARGVALRHILGDRDRAERYWAEGRLDRLEDEQARLAELMSGAALDLIASIQAGNCKKTAPPETVTPDQSAAARLASFYSNATRRDEVMIALRGHGGWDTNTFVLTPALRVTQPGPFDGLAVDRVEDDGFSSAELELAWRHGFGGSVLDREVLRGVRDRGNQVYLAARGGFDGRLNWGQLMGPHGELDFLYDEYTSNEQRDELSRFRLGLRGGLVVPDAADEADVTATPIQRVGGRAELSWSDFLFGPSEESQGMKGTHIAYRGEGWGSVEDTADAQGVAPPETWWTRHRVDARWLLMELTDSLHMGVFAGVDLRFSGGDFGHGAAGFAGLRVDGIISDRHDLWFELGYGAGGGFGPRRDRVRAGILAISTESPLEHGPAVAGHYRLTEHDGDDFAATVTVEVDHRLAGAGRYGWLAHLTTAKALFGFFGPSDFFIGGLELFLHRAGYDPGAVDIGGATLNGEIELLVSGFGLDVPIYTDEYLTIALRAEGRMVSDSTRFNGRLLGQFRALARGAVAFEIFEDYGDP